MESITIKQNNIVALSCQTSASISGHIIKSGLLDSSQKVLPLSVNIIDANNFIVYLNTTGCAIGMAYLDIKIGDVSSENIPITITKSIS